MGHASLIIKATRLCNLRCAYCHDWKEGPDQTMPFRVLARMIAAALRDPEHDVVEFIWHGGETTLLPISFYEKALFVQSRLRRPGQLVRNVIQTNGTRLSRAWLDFFHSNDFGVGISLDGPPEIHDVYRRYVTGRPSFEDVSRGLRLLRQYGVPFSVLMVIDEGALALGPDRIFDFFLQHEIKSYGLIAAVPVNRPDAGPRTPTTHYAAPAAMNAFLSRMYDRWREHGDPDIHIRELEGIHNRLSGVNPGMCTLAGGCLGNYYLIEPKGEVAHCDLFLGDPAYTLGNILEDDFTAFRSGAALRRLRAENDRAVEAMRGCEHFAVCNGWCPHARYISRRHNPDHREECCGLSDLITHVRGRLAEDAAAAV